MSYMILRKRVLTFFIFSLVFIALNHSLSIAQTTISGAVTYNGSPVCAMVLANGQYQFTCSGDGSFDLNVPLDSNGQITVFSFCSGKAPFKQVIYPSAGQKMDIQLDPGGDGDGMDISYTLQPINSSRVQLTGTITYSGSPVCAMALANGQYMFTCSGDGSFILDVPLDNAGKVALYGFCSGLPPYKVIHANEEISFLEDSDNDGYTITGGDCNDLNSSLNPVAEEICEDGIDQDCDGMDKACTSNNMYTEEYTSSGSYSYSDGILTINTIHSDFPEDEGLPVGVSQFIITHISSTIMIMIDDDEDQLIWTRESGLDNNIIGLWNLTTDADSNESVELNLLGDGSYSLFVSEDILFVDSVQNKTIIIDGNFNDWNGNDRVYFDNDGPECGDKAGLDIEEIYLTRDDSFVYLRFVLNGPLDETYGYKFGGDLRHIFVGTENGEGYIGYASSSLPWVSIPSEHVKVNGNQFECKFYINDVKAWWSDSHLGAWLDQGSETECRDEIDILLSDSWFD